MDTYHYVYRISPRFVIRSIAPNYDALSILKRQLKVGSDDPVAQEAPLTLIFSFEEAAALTMTPSVGGSA